MLSHLWNKVKDDQKSLFTQDVGYWGFKDFPNQSNTWEPLERSHPQDVGYLGFKDVWGLSKIVRKFHNTTPLGYWILRIQGYLRSNQDNKNLNKYHTNRMLDIGDSRIFQIKSRFGDPLERSQPQDVGYWGFKDVLSLPKILKNYQNTTLLGCWILRIPRIFEI